MPEYVGFEVPADSFIIGMGLDYYGELRNEPEIHAVNVAFFPYRGRTNDIGFRTSTQ